MGGNQDTADKDTQMRPMHFQLFHKVMGELFYFLMMETLVPLYMFTKTGLVIALTK